MMPGQIAGPRAGAGRRVENAARFSTLRTVTVGWITLCLSTEGAGGSSLLHQLVHGGSPRWCPPRAPVRVLAPADAWKTLRGFPPYERITVGWITLRLSTEGAGGSSLLPRPAHGGFPSMMPGQIAGPRAGVGRRVENAARFSTLRTDNRRVDNAPLIHQRRWRIEPVTSACARRLPLHDARADRRSACWRRQTRGKRCAVFHPTHGNRRVDNAPLIHRRRWRGELGTSACARRLPSMMPAEIAGPRAGVGRRVENAVRFSTLRTVTVGWIALCLSTEGAGGSSLLHQLVRGGSPRWCPRRSPVRSWRQRGTICTRHGTNS